MGSNLLAANRFFWPRGRRGILILAAILLVGGYVGRRPLAADAAVNPSDAAKARANSAIPVTVQPVESADFPVYLNGLGTVQPYDTVTVRSRVDGQVTKVNFRQGQMVNEGDLLVQIDPPPLPGRARPGTGQENAGRSHPAQRAARSRPV